MKKLILTIFAITGIFALSAQTSNRIEWSFTSKGAAQYLESGEYKAAAGDGTIEFVGKSHPRNQIP